MSQIFNAASVPLFSRAGGVPDVSGALQSYYQMMVFELLTKTVSGFQLLENAVKINFRGVMQPFSPQRLMMKAVGERAWIWKTLHSDISLTLKPDDVVLYQGIQYRVMSKQDYSLYGYLLYELVEDYRGSGP